MALTAQDLNSIKHLFDDRFDAIDARLDKHDQHFATIHEEIDALARATQAQFAETDAKIDKLSGDVEKLSEDVVVIKEFVKDHSFRITALEHHQARPA